MSFCRRTAVFLVVLFLLLPAPSRAQDVDALLEERSAFLWFEGEALGDLIIGARAQFAFVYVDSALARAVAEDSDAPEWLRSNIQFFGSRETRQKALFIVQLRTIRNLKLELPMITIGTHALSAADALTNIHYVPLGDLPPGLAVSFAVAVPLSAVKGKSVPVAVGEYASELGFSIR
jgi:hypothetical protein